MKKMDLDSTYTLIALALKNDRAGAVQLLQANGATVTDFSTDKAIGIAFLKGVKDSDQFRSSAAAFLAKSAGNSNFLGRPGNYGFAQQPTAMGFLGRPGNINFARQPTAMSFLGRPGNMNFASQPSAMRFVAGAGHEFVGQPSDGFDFVSQGELGFLGASRPNEPVKFGGLPSPGGHRGFLGKPGNYGFAGQPETMLPMQPTMGFAGGRKTFHNADGTTPAPAAADDSGGFWDTVGDVFNNAATQAAIKTGLTVVSTDVTAKANATSEQNALALQQYKLAQIQATNDGTATTAWPTWAKAGIAISVIAVTGLIVYKILHKKSAA